MNDKTWVAVTQVQCQGTGEILVKTREVTPQTKLEDVFSWWYGQHGGMYPINGLRIVENAPNEPGGGI